mgnify:CR=1 FL=1
MTPASWEHSGSYFTIGKHRHFVVDRGRDPEQKKEKETVVLVHGYPTSSYDFKDVLARLMLHYRVVIHDHLGFGLSDKPADYSYSIMEQADRALALWQHLGIQRAHLVAHDYGTTVATELIARRNLGAGFLPIELQSLTLSNGSVHIELAKLRMIQKLLRNKRIGPIIARLSSKRVFNKNMRELWYDPDALLPDEIDAMWDLLTRGGGRDVLPPSTQYLRERELYWHRWVGALQANRLRTLFLWGRHDPITGEAIARVHHEEMPGSQLRILENAGHYPQVETPVEWANGLLKFLQG